MKKKGDTDMNNAQTFIREMAESEEERPVYFNEVYNSNNWWVRHRRRERIANAALVFGLVLVAAMYFAIATGVI